MTSQKTMRIGQLAEAAGVSVQTVHFYVREGFLRPPAKVASNLALYSSECVEELELIKEL